MAPLRRLLSAARHPVAHNALALYALQAVLSLLPLVTLPWLARALGPSELGVVVFVQSFSWLVGNLVEYGFALSATREIARARGDREAMGRIAAGVLGARLILVGAASAISLATLLFVPAFVEDPRLLVFGLVMSVLHGLNPAWFFIGVERLRFLASVEVTIRLLTAVALIGLVRNEGDGMLVLSIWTGALVISVISQTAVLYRAVRPMFPTRAGSVEQLRKGWALFVSTMGLSFYSSGAVFLVGLVVSSSQTAFFASAERIVRAALRGTEPVVTAAYPRVNALLERGETQRAERLALVTLAFQLVLGLLASGLLILLSPLIVDTLFGDRFEDATPMLQVLSLMIPFAAIGVALSRHWLLPRGHDRFVTRVVVIIGAGTAVATLVVGHVAGAFGVSWVLVAAEAALATGYAMGIWRRGLMPGRVQPAR